MDSATIDRVTARRERIDTDGLRASTDIVALIGKYTALRKRGSAHVGCCPFHNEKTPSFYVYPADGRYHCFGCGVDGNCIDFAMAIDGVDFKEAATRLGAGTIDGKSYREIIEARRRQAVDVLAEDVAQNPWKYLEAEWEADQARAAAAWRGENSATLSPFEEWLLRRTLTAARSETFRGTAEYEYLQAEWEQGR